MRTQRFYFHKKRVKSDDDILQLFKMFENVTVTWRKVTVNYYLEHISNITSKAAALAEAEPEPA
jgi:hypothetical protein